MGWPVSMLLYPPGLQNGRDVVDFYFSCWFVRISLKCRTDRGIPEGAGSCTLLSSEGLGGALEGAIHLPKEGREEKEYPLASRKKKKKVKKIKIICFTENQCY